MSPAKTKETDTDFSRNGLKSQISELQNNINALYNSAMNANMALGGGIASFPQEDKADKPSAFAYYGLQSCLVDMLSTTYLTIDLMDQNNAILHG